MNVSELPDDSHVVRYVRPGHVREDGSVDGECFKLRTQEATLSINWLDYFEGRSRESQLREIRRAIRLNLRRNGRFAELNVGETKRAVGGLVDHLRFVHAPRAATPRFRPDPSHSEITGLPSGDSLRGTLVCAIMAKCVTAAHPALK